MRGFKGNLRIRQICKANAIYKSVAEYRSAWQLVITCALRRVIIALEKLVVKRFVVTHNAIGYAEFKLIDKRKVFGILPEILISYIPCYRTGWEERVFLIRSEFRRFVIPEAKLRQVFALIVVMQPANERVGGVVV